MSFVRRGMGDVSDGYVYTNPDGTPTYDGNPYDPYDTSNPYNQLLAASSGGTIAIQTTSMGTPSDAGPAPLTNYTAPGVAPVTSTGLPATVQTNVAPTPNPLTSIVTAIGNILAPKPPTVVASGVPVTVQSASAIGGISLTTWLLLGGVAAAAAVVLGKKRQA